MRWWLHNVRRRHYYFTQASAAFFICAPRWRGQRPTEYSVAMAGLPPVVVTRDVFVNLDQRLHAGGAASLDEVATEEEDREP